MNYIRTGLAALTLAAGTLQSATAQVVQKGTHHLSVGYEAPGYLDAFVSLRFISLNTVGPFVVNYQYAPWNKVNIGLQLGYVQGATPEVALPIGGVTSSYKATYGGLTTLLRADYHYLKSNKADLYSGIAVGLGFGTGSVTESGKTKYSGSLDLLAFRINVAGFRYMLTDHWGAYAEVGTFYINPIGTLGVSAKFGKPKEKKAPASEPDTRQGNDEKKG